MLAKWYAVAQARWPDNMLQKPTKQQYFAGICKNKCSPRCRGVLEMVVWHQGCLHEEVDTVLDCLETLGSARSPSNKQCSTAQGLLALLL